MKKTLRDPRVVSALLSALCLGLCLLLPQTAQNAALLACAAVLPQGGAACLRAWVCAPDNTPARSTSAPSSVLPDVRTQTPNDILQWIEEAKRAAPTQQKDGEIRAKTFGEANATDVLDTVLLRNATEDMQPDFALIRELPLPLEADKSKPAVLLYHTHTTEGYETLDRDWYAADVVTRTEDAKRSVVRVGDAIAAELERAGFPVLHDTTIHDEPYNGAYDRSRETVAKILEENPQIAVTLDVHRDAIEQNNGVRIKPVTVINGKKAAQIMLIAGAPGGKVESFPQWETNLAFAMRVQASCEETAPTLMRPIFFCHRKYNMDMTPCSLLVEVGSDANTLEEAVYAGRLFGHALSQLLEQYAHT